MNELPYPNDIPFENIPEDTSSLGQVNKLIDFLVKYLPSFSKERNPYSSQNENDLTEELYKHLTRKRKINSEKIEYPFEFQPEKGQKKKNQKGHSRRTDIAVRINTIDFDMEVIYCIEAKKLPTDKIGGKREKEYLFGRVVKGKYSEKGGVERFKNEIHGLDDKGNLLDRNGIVAYVTESSFDFWLNQINKWIEESDWENEEFLKKNEFGLIGKLSSKHSRVTSGQVDINHFWINIEG